MGTRWIGPAAIARAAPSLAAPALAVLAAIGATGPSGAEPAPDGRFRAMVERPLFAPSRRPPPAPAPPIPSDAPPAMPAPPPDLALSGVIAGGRGGVALLKRPGDAAPVRLGLGGHIDGWTVAEIHPRAIVLSRDARSVTVGLSAPPR